MSIDGGDSITMDAETYLSELEATGQQVENNLRTSQRIANGEGVANIAPMHPAEYFEVYPDAGGVIGKLTQELGPVPGMKLAFDSNASPAEQTPEPSVNPDPMIKS